MEREQERIRGVLEHFGISIDELDGVPFTEIPNNENTRRLYGVERIAIGRKEGKIRIILDVDMDYPVFILRVSSKDSHQEEKEVLEHSSPNK